MIMTMSVLIEHFIFSANKEIRQKNFKQKKIIKKHEIKYFRENANRQKHLDQLDFYMHG